MYKCYEIPTSYGVDDRNGLQKEKSLAIHGFFLGGDDVYSVLSNVLLTVRTIITTKVVQIYPEEAMTDDNCCEICVSIR